MVPVVAMDSGVAEAEVGGGVEVEDGSYGQYAGMQIQPTRPRRPGACAVAHLGS